MAQSQVFRGNARSIVMIDGVTHFRYHQTSVVKVNPEGVTAAPGGGLVRSGTITLDSGGHRTNTTKLAMNQASNQNGLGFQVYQKDFGWYVTWRGGKFEFFDGMVLQ